MRLLGASALFAFATQLAASAAVAATVEGKVEGASGDVIVYFEDVPPSAGAGQRTAVVRQRYLQFEPRILPVVQGTTVEFCNDDGVGHNVFSPMKAEPFDLGTFPRGECRPRKFDQLGAHVLLCNVHIEMVAYVLVLPTELFARAGPDGSFRIDGVPEGKRRLVVWRPRKPERRVEVTVGSPSARVDVDLGERG